jgi:cytoskeletal protein RodZ
VGDVTRRVLWIVVAILLAVNVYYIRQLSHENSDTASHVGGEGAAGSSAAVPTKRAPTKAPVTKAPATTPPATKTAATKTPATKAPATRTPATTAAATTAAATTAAATTAPATRTPATTAPASETPASAPHVSTTPSRHDIQLDDTFYFARPFEAVQVAGTYLGPGQGAKIQVQLNDGHRWVPFPLPATTDRAGQFTAHLEWGAIGRYRLRVVDPRTKTSSPVATLYIS